MEQGTTAKLCECGCGQPAPISPRSDTKAGYVKGQPRRFILGHQCSHPTLFVEVGQRFGWGVVIDALVRIPPSGRTPAIRGARLLCDCGNEYIAKIHTLLDCTRLSCGCRRRSHRVIDRAGERYGRLLAVRRVDDIPPQRGNSTWWLCRCDCGNETTVAGNRLGSGKTSSCGCLTKEPRKGYVPGQAARNRVRIGYQQAARSRGYAWELTDEEFYRLISLDCFYCGASPATVSRSGPYSGEFVYNGVDRMDNTLGYVLGNVITCCKTCNHAKRDMSFDDFLAWIARLTEYHWFHPELMPSRLLKGGV